MQPRSPVNQPGQPGPLIAHLPYPSPDTCGTVAHLHCPPGILLKSQTYLYAE